MTQLSLNEAPIILLWSDPFLLPEPSSLALQALRLFLTDPKSSVSLCPPIHTPSLCSHRRTLFVLETSPFLSGLATGLCLSVSPEATQAGRPCRVPLQEGTPHSLSTTTGSGTAREPNEPQTGAQLTSFLLLFWKLSLLGWLTGRWEEVVTCMGRR